METESRLSCVFLTIHEGSFEYMQIEKVLLIFEIKIKAK